MKSQGLTREQFHRHFGAAFRKSGLSVAKLAEKTYYSTRSVYDWVEERTRPRLADESSSCYRRLPKSGEEEETMKLDITTDELRELTRGSGTREAIDAALDTSKTMMQGMLDANRELQEANKGLHEELRAIRQEQSNVRELVSSHVEMGFLMTTLDGLARFVTAHEERALKVLKLEEHVRALQEAINGQQRQRDAIRDRLRESTEAAMEEDRRLAVT